MNHSQHQPEPSPAEADTSKSRHRQRKRRAYASFRHSYGRDPRWWKALAGVLGLTVVVLVVLVGVRGNLVFRGDAQSYYQRGLDHYQNKDYPGAVIELKNALEQDPGFTKARKLLGQTYLALNEASRARQELVLAKELGIAEGFQDAAVRYEDAVDRFSRRDFRGAIIQLRRVLEAEPANGPAHTLIGRAYLEVDNGHEAEVHLRQARRDGASDTLIAEPLARAYLLQKKYPLLFSLMESGNYKPRLRARLLTLGGRGSLAQGESDQAEKLFRRAAELAPDSLAPLIGLARIRLRQGRIDEAQALADRARRLAADDSEVWHLQAEIMRYRHNLEQALAYYDKALALDPARPESRKGRAAALLDLHRDQEALAELKAMHMTSSTDPQAAYMYVLALARNDRLDQARAVLEQVALVIDALDSSFVRNDPPTLLISGLINYARKNFERAYEDLKRFTALRPGNLESRQLLGTLMLRRGDAEGAVDILAPVMKAAMDSPQALVVLGSAYNRLGRYTRAQRMFERAVELVPDRAGLRNRLALSRLAGGQRDLALGDLKSRFARDPGVADTGMLLGLVHLKQREFDQALAVARELIERQPGNAMNYNLAGSAQLGLGDSKAARASFLKSLKVKADFVPGLFNLAKLNLRQGNLDAARAGLLKITELQPRQIGALLQLAAIDTRLKHLDQALDWLQRARKADPGNLLIGLRLVEFYLAVDKPKKALQLAQDLEARYPQNLPVLAGLSRARFALGDTQLAAGILQTMAGYAAGDARKLRAVAVQQIQQGDRAGARLTLRRILEQHPGDTPTYSLLIEFALGERNFAEALALAGELQRRQPQSAAGDLAAGEVHMARRDYAAAAAAFGRVLERQPGASVLLRYFQARRKAGDPAAAVQVLQDWLARHPQDLKVRRALASAYLDLGRLDEAIKLHESLLESLGDDALLLNNLAGLYLQSGDPRALKLAERAHALAPEQPATLDTLGWVLVRGGESLRGLKYLRQAEARVAGDPRVGYHIAVALDRLGRGDDARRQLEAVLRSGQHFEEAEAARKLLARLEGLSS